MIYILHCSVPDIVHPLYPKHLILCFALFSDALTLGHLLCQQEHLLRRLFVDVGKVGIQLTAGQGNAPPEQAVHPLKPFSIKTQYLFQIR